MDRFVDFGYFEALGIPLLRGQTFDQNQRFDHTNEVIISSSFARQYFGDEDPLGKQLVTLGERPFKIVGIVGDTRFEIAEPSQPTFYFPLYIRTEGAGTLAIQSSHDVTSLALPIQEIVRQLDAELPVSDILTMDQLIGKSTLDASFNTTLLLAFAAFSLVLAAVGLFGVLSYIVRQRTSEIGIRVAVGALDVCHEGGARSVSFTEIDPFFFAYNRLKKFTTGYRLNHLYKLRRLPARAFDLIWCKGSIVADHAILAERLPIRAWRFVEWLGQLEQLAAPGAHVVICPHWRNDGVRRRVEDAKNSSLSRSMLSCGYETLPEITGHNHQPEYPLTFHKRIN